MKNNLVSKLDNDDSLLSVVPQNSYTVLLKFEDETLNLIYLDSKFDFEPVPKKFGNNSDTNNLLVKFCEFENLVFTSNLRAVDGDLPLLVATLVLVGHHKLKCTKISELCSIVEGINPLEIDIKIYPNYYKLKIKRFLMGLVLGLSNKTPWSYTHEAAENCLAGNELSTFFKASFFNPKYFEDCLFDNTMFEIFSAELIDNGSTPSKNGEFKLKLNLQIRFFH